MIDSIRQRVRAEQFAPTWLGPFVNPFYLARRSLRREIASLSGQVGGRLLDVGCGRKPYRDLFKVSDYVGLEIDTPVSRAIGMADCYYDGTRFPFDDASFDTVLCNQVLEHVFNPDEFLGEVTRVLRPNGRLLLTVPFVWDEHEQPFDYARYSSFGLAHLLGKAGFKVVEQRKTLADLSLIGQLLNAYLYKRLWSRRGWANLLVMLFAMAPVALLSRLVAVVTPTNSDLYLDNIVLAELAR